MKQDDIMVCRCEDVSLKELHQCLDEGYTTFEEVKRILRIGMGPCQGITCGLLVQREIAKYLNLPVHEVKTHQIRPLVTGVKLKTIVEGVKNES
ncbi:MAG: (2Fe-2S)-binding protein [Candidatus Izemoplasmataceae bacterium]